jgi:hypothetical protein
MMSPTNQPTPHIGSAPQFYELWLVAVVAALIIVCALVVVNTIRARRVRDRVRAGQ